jgi:hypothetical protein
MLDLWDPWQESTACAGRSIGSSAATRERRGAQTGRATCGPEALIAAVPPRIVASARRDAGGPTELTDLIQEGVRGGNRSPA